MSRSRKKHPVTGMTTAESEKQFKALEHRRERRNAKSALSISLDDTDRRLFRSYGNPAAGPKDGKQRWVDDQHLARRK